MHGELDATRIEAWRTALTRDEIGLFERVAARRLHANGYALSGAGAKPGTLAIANYARQYSLRRANLDAGRARDALQRRREQAPLADLGD